MSIAEKFVTMEYGPAPEDPKETLGWLDRHQRQFGHFINNRWVPPSGGQFFESNDPSTGERLANVAQGSTADIDAAVKAARAALPQWQALSPHARSRYLYALARQVQKHSRRLAVLETMDNGKPIRESRDIDIPLVARHFYYHAGWAQLLPEEFPAADAGLENRPRAGHGKHRRAEARRVHPAHRAGVRRNLPGNWTSGGRSEHRDWRRLHRGSSGQAPGRGQDRLHRLHRSWPRDPQRHRAESQEAFARTRRQIALHRIRRRRPRQRGRGPGGRHLV